MACAGQGVEWRGSQLDAGTLSEGWGAHAWRERALGALGRFSAAAPAGAQRGAGGCSGGSLHTAGSCCGGSLAWAGLKGREPCNKTGVAPCACRSFGTACCAPGAYSAGSSAALPVPLHGNNPCCCVQVSALCGRCVGGVGTGGRLLLRSQRHASWEGAWLGWTGAVNGRLDAKLVLQDAWCQCCNCSSQCAVLQIAEGSLLPHSGQRHAAVLPGGRSCSGVRPTAAALHCQSQAASSASCACLQPAPARGQVVELAGA